MIRTSILLILTSYLLVINASGQIDNHPEEKQVFIYSLTDEEAEAAIKGWELYKMKKFSFAYNDGHFTNPVEHMLGYEFWSNGKIAILNLDKKNHCENFFLIEDNKLSYLGAAGFDGSFIHLAGKYQKLLSPKLSYNSPNGLFLKLYFSKSNPQDMKFSSRLSFIFDEKTSMAAEIGWDLYKRNKYLNSPHGGHYTFSYVDKKGFGFWSDGKTAKVDRNNDGHYETIFKVRYVSLVYVGTFEIKDSFVEAAEKFHKLFKDSQK